MDHGFEHEMKELAIKTLKLAHSSFMAGALDDYEAHLREAAAAIEGFARLGVSGDNPRFLWVDRLACDWKLLDALRELKHPKRLVTLYAECLYEPFPRSLVVGRETPYLPASCTDVFAFYGVSLEEADGVAHELGRALALYARMTDGGGAGCDLLFQAGVELRRGHPRKARALAMRARGLGAAWLQPLADRLLKEIAEGAPAVPA